MSFKLIYVLSLLLSVVSCSSKSEKDEKPSQKRGFEIHKALKKEHEAISKGYELKNRGENSEALKLFESACKNIERIDGSSSAQFGSCIDDMASIHLRTGDHQRALSLYNRALDIVSKANSADPKAVYDIKTRIDLVAKLEKAGVMCNEPGMPSKESPLPHYPVVEDMQKAIGQLNDQIYDCKKGSPDVVTIRTIITGDGKVVHTEARGPYRGTDVGNCVVKKFEEIAPKADFVKFRACFRGFTYPFVVGDIPKRKTSETQNEEVGE